MSLTWAGLTLGYSDKPPQLALRNRSFSVTTLMTIRVSDGSLYRSQILETYSGDLKRATVSYKLPAELPSREGLPLEGTFYISEEGHFLLDEATGICRPSSSNKTSRLFRLNQLPKDGGDERSYVGGPAWLMFFVDGFRDEFVRPEVSTMTMRNIESFYYTLNLNLTAGSGTRKRTEFQIYYSKQQRTKRRTEASQTPIGILMSGPDEDEIVTYDFGPVELLEESWRWELFAEHHDESAQMHPLAVRRASGCTAGTMPAQTLFHTDKYQTFSFRARSGPSQDLATVSFFVAYHSTLGYLRIDRSSPALSTSSLISISHERAYHTIEEHRIVGGRTLMGEVLKYEPGREGEPMRGLDGPSCVVLDSKLAGSRNQAYKQSKLLAGAEWFTYLGPARVRGIEAKAYEAYNSSWPTWYRQPVSYFTLSIDGSVGSRDIREPTDLPAGHVLNTVVYLGAHNDQDHLLLIEIFLVRHADKQVVDKTTLPISDFAWALGAQAPNGRSGEETFSLADRCAALDERADNHYATLSLTGEVSLQSGAGLEWLEMPSRRNLALLDTLGVHLRITAPTVYDIQSRVKLTPSGREQDRQLEASFRLANHLKQVTKLVALGRAQLTSYNAERLLRISNSFQFCAFLAAHRKSDTIFAFQGSTEECFIDIELDAASRTDNYTLLQALGDFKFDQSGNLEIFRTFHQADELQTVEDSISAFSRGAGRLEFLRYRTKLNLLDPQLTSTAVMVIKSIKVTDLNEKNSFKLNETILPSTNKFPNLALIESDPLNRRVWPVGSTRTMATTTGGLPVESKMNFEQCQAACLADFDCESFSLCHRAAGTECILSRAYLRSPPVVADIMKALDQLDKGANGPRSVSIHLSGTDSLTLVRHPNCELHSKIHLDLFEPSARLSLALVNRRVRQVGGRELCARFCVQQTMRVLREQSVSELGQTLAATGGSGEKRSAELIENILKKHRKRAAEVCGTFLYLDEAELANWEDLRASWLRRVLETDRDRAEGLNGFCITGERLSGPEVDKLKEEGRFEVGKQIREKLFESFKFKFETLFESQWGLRLVASPLDQQESAAYMSAVTAQRGRPMAEWAQEALRQVVERGANMQREISMVGNRLVDASSCARECFSQTSGPWPACKSFDLVTVPVGRFIHPVCFLNSITMHELVQNGQFDLIAATNLDNRSKMFHYEPRAGFVYDELQVAAEYELKQFKMSPRASLNSRLGPFGASLIFFLALISGLLLGTWRGPALLSRCGPLPNLAAAEDRDDLVDRPTVEFSNLVNSDGRIPEQQATMVTILPPVPEVVGDGTDDDNDE